MSYELQGTIKQIYDVQTFASGFSKREIVVTTEHDKYPQHIKLEFAKEKCALLDKLSVGQRVKVAFDIRGSEYNGKYFVNLTGWKIGPAEGGGDSVDYDEAPPSQSYQQRGRGGNAGASRQQQAPPPPPPSYDYGSDDDMPF
jgi:single-strand DNA-binding protein